MFRNLIFGSLLVPLGAALPVVIIAISVGIGRAILDADSYAMTVGIGQSFYVIVGAYIFGWVAALLIGAGNGLVWVLVPRPTKRLLLAIPVGCVAVLLAFGHMLFGVGGLGAWPTLAMFCVQGIIGSLFSTLIVMTASRVMAVQWP